MAAIRELRITAAEAADGPLREVPCPHCKGRGCCYRGGNDGSWPDPDWCCDCGGPGVVFVTALPSGASIRLGRAIVERLEGR